MLTVVRRGPEEVCWKSVTMQVGMSIVSGGDLGENGNTSNVFRLVRFQGELTGEDLSPIQLPIRPNPIFFVDFGRHAFYTAQALESGESLETWTKNPVVEFRLWTHQEDPAAPIYLSMMTVGKSRTGFILQTPLVLTDEEILKNIADEQLMAFYHQQDIFPAMMYFAVAADNIEGRGDFALSFFDFFKTWISGLNEYTFHVDRYNEDSVAQADSEDGPFDKDPLLLPIVRVCPKHFPEANVIPSDIVPCIPLDTATTYYLGYISN